MSRSYPAEVAHEPRRNVARGVPDTDHTTVFVVQDHLEARVAGEAPAVSGWITGAPSISAPDASDTERREMLAAVVNGHVNGAP
jgi:hypothetical protein